MAILRIAVAASVLAAACIAALLTAACAADTSDPRSTDIVLLEVSSLGGLVAFGEPHRVTDRDGYDNQPAFTADGKGVLFSSRRGIQSDIYLYDIATDERDRLTLTLESEFSPQPLPDAPGFSCVRVEQDGRQRLWAFDPESNAPPRVLLASPDYVGYYAWSPDGRAALHVLGDPTTLQLARPPGPPIVVGDGVGRSLQAVPGRAAFSYSATGPDGNPWIYVLDLDTGDSRALAAALEGSQDHAWWPDGTLLMARDATIHALPPSAAGAGSGVEGSWTLWIDLEEYGIEAITRIAVSPTGDRMALVASD